MCFWIAELDEKLNLELGALRLKNDTTYQQWDKNERVISSFNLKKIASQNSSYMYMNVVSQI